MKKNIILLSLVLLCIICLIILGKKFLTPADKIENSELIAMVGPNEIRAEQVKREMLHRKGNYSENGNKKALLEEMIEYETLLVKAIEAGLDKDPDIIRSYRNMLVGRFKQKNLTPQIENTNISDSEIAEYYKKNIAAYTRDARVLIAIIYMKTHSTMSDSKQSEIHERMNEAREKALALNQDKNFGKLALEYSEDQSTRYKGGDIGWVEQGRRYRWNEAVISAGLSLENPGDISKIITTDSGLFLVKLVEKKPSEVIPLEKVKGRIRHKLMLTKRKDIEKNFIAKIRSSTPVKIYPENLEKIEMPSMSSSEKKPPSIP